MLLAVYLHRLDPFALGPFHVGPFEGLGIRWYGLAYVAGFLAGYALILGLARRRRILLEPDRVGDFVLAVAVGTVVGGRLGYVLFYQPWLLWTFSPAPPFWGLLAINDGGMASHGGIAGIVLACFYFHWRHGLPRLHGMDLCSLFGPIGIFFGRIANFVNGELLGRSAPADLPWAVKFPQEIYAWARPEHPMHGKLSSPAFERVVEMTRRLPAEATERAEGLYQKVVIATQKSDAVAAQLRPMLTPLHPSQLYAALLEGGVVFLVLLFVWRKPRKPGVVSAWFGITYATVRIFDEVYRKPDAFIGFEALGLTRGQWLSVLLLVIAVIGGLIVARRPVEKVGGIVPF